MSVAGIVEIFMSWFLDNLKMQESHSETKNAGFADITKSVRSRGFVSYNQRGIFKQTSNALSQHLPVIILVLYFLMHCFETST